MIYVPPVVTGHSGHRNMYRVALDAIEPDPPLVMGHFGHRPLGLTSLNPFAKSRKIAPTVAQKVGWFGWRSPVRPLPSRNPSAAGFGPCKIPLSGGGASSILAAPRG